MGLFSRFFSKPNDLNSLRKAMSQQRYADALIIIEEIDQTEMSAEECSELQAIAITAGDTLAKMNLDEGLFFLRDDQHQRAMEHLHLAQNQVMSTPLKDQILHALKQLNAPQPATKIAASDCGSCSSCGPKVDSAPEALEQLPQSLAAIFVAGWGALSCDENSSK